MIFKHLSLIEEKSHTNHLTHVVLHTLALGGGLFGLYVIYTNKIKLGKDHFLTWHAWGGLLAITLYVLNVTLFYSSYI